jgi:type II secretory pathway component HofQ
VTKQLPTLALVFVFALASPTIVRAQDKPAAPAPKPPAPSVPVKVTVVISRSQGEKKISSMPYTLSLTGNHANLRLGTQVPVNMNMMPAAPKTEDGKSIPQIGSIQYRDVGTNIDCQVSTLDDGRFTLNLTVDDSSVYADEQALPGSTRGNPSFRSFRASNSMILKDGQTGQFTSATDKVTGETVRVDVTLTVVK